MSTATQLLLIAGNLVALLTGFVAFVAWFRRWLVKVVSEPVTNLSRELKDVRKATERAHARLDRLQLRSQ